jgi:hypothetical protein
MSVKAMAWALEQQELAAPVKLVPLALSDTSDDQEVCWPGIRHISEKTELSHSSVL